MDGAASGLAPRPALEAIAEATHTSPQSAGMDSEAIGLAPEHTGETVACMEVEASGLAAGAASMDGEASGLAPRPALEAIAGMDSEAIGRVEASGLAAGASSMDGKASGLAPSPGLETIEEPTHTSPQARQLHRQASAATAASSYLEDLSDAESSESTTVQMGCTAEVPLTSCPTPPHPPTSRPSASRSVC